MTRLPLDPTGLAQATIAAILAPVVPMAILFGSASGPAMLLVVPCALLIGVAIAALHVLPLWLPAYLLLRHFGAMGWWQAGLLGFLCGGAPSYFIAFPASDATPRGMFFGLCGVVGGLAFHWRLERDNL
jgi:hypothetical protein